ncbi:DUF5696 domain-containing protein [Vallitalea sediminicola]
MKNKKIKYIITFLVIAVLLLIALKKCFEEVPNRITMGKYDYSTIIVNDEETMNQSDDYDFTIPDTFERVAENDQLELFLDEESIAIAVRNKVDGYTWYSYDVDMNMEEKKISKEMNNYIKSGISVITYDKFTPGRRTVLDKDVKKTYQKSDKGFIVTIDFLKPKIKLDLRVEIQGGDLITSIPRESIEEYNEDLWTPGNDDVSINEIVVYPFLGSTTGKDNGYLVIPDGSGAIIKLDETPKYATGYVAPVYGKDLGYANTLSFGSTSFSVKPLESIVLPIYGIIHEENDNGVLVIAESGASYATYNYVSKNVSTEYYQSYFTYNYRTTYSQFQSRIDEEQHVLGFQKEPNNFDLVQRYVFLNKDKADYVGVAKGYRDFLTKQSRFSKKADSKKTEIPLKIDFINNEIEMGTFNLENVKVTSYDQAKNIVKTFIDKGNSNLNVTFKTYILDKSAYRFEVFKELGGRKDFKSVLNYFKYNNVKFNYYMDYARTNHKKTKYTASKMSRQDLSVRNDKSQVYNYLNDPKYFMDFAKWDIKKLDEYGIDSIAFDGFTGSLFTHYDKGTIGYSNEGMEYIKNLMTYFNKNNIETNIYIGDAYLYPYMTDYYETPICSSNLMFIDKTIPLVSLVVSGNMDMYSPYMNFSSNDDDAILRLIEFGIYPAFVLTGEPTYSIKYSDSSNVYVSQNKYLEKRIDSYYEKVNDALSHVIGSELINHMSIDDNVVMTEYANGKKIVINYNESDYIYNDITIKGKGFVVI